MLLGQHHFILKRKRNHWRSLCQCLIQSDRVYDQYWNNQIVQVCLFNSCKTVYLLHSKMDVQISSLNVWISLEKHMKLWNFSAIWIQCVVIPYEKVHVVINQKYSGHSSGKLFDEHIFLWIELSWIVCQKAYFSCSVCFMESLQYPYPFPMHHPMILFWKNPPFRYVLLHHSRVLLRLFSRVGLICLQRCVSICV